MTIIYRLLSFFINAMSLLVIVMLLILLSLSLSNPTLLLPVFVLAAVVLYSWFSSQFRRRVLQQREHVQHSLRDWVRVNGIVTIIFSLLYIPSVIALIIHPSLVQDSYKEMTRLYGTKIQEVPASTFIGVAYFMLAWLIALFIHVFWTFALLKKNEEFFEKNSGEEG